MKHYFRPGREDFRAAIFKAMPKMLADGGAQRSAKEEMRSVLKGMTAKTCNRDRERLITLLVRLCNPQIPTPRPAASPSRIPRWHNWFERRRLGLSTIHDPAPILETVGTMGFVHSRRE